LQGEILVKYSQEWIVDITDISEFVRVQRKHMVSQNQKMLLLPYEEVYPIKDSQIAKRLNL